MAQLVVAAAGATVGFMIGGPVGAQVGWMAGSIAGGVLFGPDPAQGPRITDGKFSANTYGQSIAFGYGTMRHAAQVVWWSGLHERSEEVGGKGADGETVYHYSCDLLVSACEGPVGAVLRIWGNGRLIWENDGTPDGRVDAALISAGNVRLYLGDEEQVPDPLYEAGVGVENAVAYRGQCVVMLQGLQLAFSGNRPPAIEVEVAEVSTAAAVCPVDPVRAVNVQQAGLFVGPNQLWSQASGAAVLDRTAGLYYVVTDGDDGTTRQLEVYSTLGSAPALVSSIALPKWRPGPASVGSALSVGGIAHDPENGLVRVCAGTTAPTLGGVPIEYTWDGQALHESAAQLHVATLPAWGDFPSDGQYGGTGALYGALAAIYPDAGAGMLGEVGWWNPISSSGLSRLAHLMNGDQGGGIRRAWHHSTSDGRTIWTADVLYVPKAVGVLGGINFAWRADCWQGFRDDNGAVTEIEGADGSDATNRDVILVYAPARKKVYVVTRHDGIAVIDLDATAGDSGALARELTPYPPGLEIGNFGVANAVWNARGDGLVLINYDGGGIATTTMWLFDPDLMEIIVGPCAYTGTLPVWAPSDLGDGRFVCIYGDDQVAIVHAPGGGTATGEPVTLRSIVEDLCARAQLPAGNLDATAGTDLVAGYKVARQSTARAALEALVPGYHFDMPESGEKLVLRKRGGAPVATIDSGELGAHIFTLTGDPPAAYECEHVDEGEAPRSLELVYIDAAADYDPGLQRASRQIGEARAPLRVEVPVVFAGGATEAQRAAWTLLLEAHASKSPVKLALTHRFDAIDAADPLLVAFSDQTLRRVRVAKLTRARPLLEIEGVLEDDVYTQTMAGVDRGQGPTQSPIEPLAGTVLALLDVPPLRDTDDVLIVYAAMAQSVRAFAWPGAVAFRSVDGATYESVLSATAAATIGATVGVLGDWWGNVWDNENTVDVLLSSGTFSSATDIGVLGGANAIAIQSGGDWEIVQFRDAELVATNMWRLSHLLRGRRGTERAMGGHAVGDRVVLLSAASVHLLPYQVAEIGIDRHFKGVTAGQAVSDAPAQTLAFNGNSLRPLSPVHIAGVRAGADLTISWVPRARIGALWNGAAIVALDETIEAYEIDVLDGDTIMRTLTASTPSIVYTEAQQIEDFGSAQAAIAVAVHQMSQRVGRGHAGAATV